MGTIIPIFIAASRGIHLFPDWYAVAETNYLDAPSCWGRTPESVLDNLRRWNAEYAIVYQDSGISCERMWERAGFTVVGMFDWKDALPALKGIPLWQSETPPCWWLLKQHQATS